VLRELERQAVRQDAARVRQGDRPVGQRLRIQLAREQPVRLEVEAGKREGREVLEVTALRLEVMLREVHALTPDDPRQKRHAFPRRDLRPFRTAGYYRRRGRGAHLLWTGLGPEREGAIPDPVARGR